MSEHTTHSGSHADQTCLVSLDFSVVVADVSTGASFLWVPNQPDFSFSFFALDFLDPALSTSLGVRGEDELKLRAKITNSLTVPVPDALHPTHPVPST
jgi:hypothetical protein